MAEFLLHDRQSVRNALEAAIGILNLIDLKRALDASADELSKEDIELAKAALPLWKVARRRGR